MYGANSEPQHNLPKKQAIPILLGSYGNARTALELATQRTA